MIPGPYGSAGHYFNATPGFQSLSRRALSRRRRRLGAGARQRATGGGELSRRLHQHEPVRERLGTGDRSPSGGRDVISFSNAPGFDAYSDGHVAVVVGSSVGRSGDGTITLAQENVEAGYWIDRIDVVHWRVGDPTSPGDALFGFGYAEWLHVTPYRSAEASSSVALLSSSASGGSVAPVSALVSNLGTNLGHASGHAVAHGARKHRDPPVAG